MDRFRQVVVALIILAVVGLFFLDAGLLSFGSHDRAEVTIRDEAGESLATVDAAIAETRGERYTGLSDHEGLAEGEGMLFVHDDEAERTYVMREMDFGIDMLFVGADGTISTIHEAPAPSADEDGADQAYVGEAKWVLEVPLGFAADHGIEPGHEIDITYVD